MNSRKAVPSILFFLVLLSFVYSTVVTPLHAQPAAAKAGKTRPTTKKDQSPPAAAPALADARLLATVEKELHRGQTELAKLDPAPYFTSYNIPDADSMVVLGTQGGILTSTRQHQRVADVSMRI